MQVVVVSEMMAAQRTINRTSIPSVGGRGESEKLRKWSPMIGQSFMQKTGES